MDAMSMPTTTSRSTATAFPATEPIWVTEGDLAGLRFINPSQTTHQMHLQFTDMALIAMDGEPLDVPQRLNRPDIAQGETCEVFSGPTTRVGAGTRKPDHGDHGQGRRRSRVALVSEAGSAPDLAEGHGVTYDGARNDGRARNERHARDGSMSDTEAM
jgi:FtsP/CotA-like multicopper oxidase with cupredoxin domain